METILIIENKNIIKFLQLKNLEIKINYKFNDNNLLIQSMTHRSYASKLKTNIIINNNETLEFLGDSILNFVSASHLFKSIKNIDEGKLTQLRAAYICKLNLANTARELKLFKHIRTSKSMQKKHLTQTANILSNTLEALIGAIYIDGGLKSAKKFINHTLGDPSKKKIITHKNYKTTFQEKIQKICGLTPIYSLKKLSGPAHNPKFYMELYVNKIKLSSGYGKTKKSASLNCANNALNNLSKLDEHSIRIKILQYDK